jgi:hypothetical protein
MGKPKSFQYSKNRRKAWKKKKKLPNIGCDEVKQSWDSRKSLQANLREMGLSADPNKSVRIPTAKEMMNSNGEEVVAAIAPKQQQSRKPKVIQDLETIANAEQPLRMRLAEPEVNYCIYMMEKYGENYAAMAHDERNYYQDTPKQIRRKILSFKSLPDQYNAYLNTRSSTCSNN